MRIFAKIVLLGSLSSLVLGGLFAFADERYPGGVKASVKDQTENAFGRPFPSLSREENRHFFVGNSFFKLAWVRAPASTDGRDGLGPTFNAVSCSSCHLRDGRGRGARNGAIELSILYRFSDNHAYGEQLNTFGIDGVPGEAWPDVVYYNYTGRFADGEEYELREPSVTFRDWAFGRPAATMKVSARVAPQLIGLGLLEKISEDEIVAGADPDDHDADGIRGEVNWVWDIESSRVTLGRFGWKAEQPTVRQQNAAAFIGDMGLTTNLFMEENCPTPQTACAQAMTGGKPEVETQAFERLNFYMETLAVPQRRNMDDPRVVEGKKLFTRIGCNQCHRESWQIEPDWVIYPYTDMLLHDMGEGLADKTLGKESVRTKWRTPPLWGVGLIPVVNRHSELLHDGRARNVQEAILWHGGEASAAQQSFKSLEKHERQAVIEFVNSL